MSGPRGAFAGAFALAALSAIAIGALYVRTLDYGLVWMDETEIGEGEIVLAPAAPWTAAFTRPLHRTAEGEPPANPYYRPLQILAVTAVHRVAGPAPGAYRVLSLALATATVAAFGALAWMLFGRLEPALAAAALAAVHPAGIEAWVWISGLGDAASTFFALASVGLGLTAASWGGARAGAAGALALVSFGLALLAKEKAVVVPVLFALVFAAQYPRERTPERRSGVLRRGMVLAAALGVLAGAYVLLWRPAMLGRVALAASPIGGSRVTHLLTAVASWPDALGWLFAPLRSTTSDAVRIVTSPADPAFLLGLALAALSAIATVALFRRGRPIAALGVAWIWIAFLPTANLFPQIHARAERYLFLSVFGAALLLVDLAGAAAASRMRRRAGLAALAIVALVWAQRTWVRAPVWRSTEALFAQDAGSDPSFREGRFHLARALFASGRHAEADRYLRALAASLDGGAGTWSYVNALGVRQLACANDLALGRGAPVAAELDALARTHPGAAAHPALQSCRADALERLGRLDDALAIQERIAGSIAGDPPPATSLALARLHARLGHHADAQRWLARARRDGPREPAFDWQLRQVEKRLR